jgi:hypothetical protein
MDVLWAQKPDGEWFSLDEAVEAVGLQKRGVYIIWIPSTMPGRPGAALKVASGNLAVRLAFERTDPFVYQSPVPALVTWAEVGQEHHLGIVRYLWEVLEPALWDSLPDAEPIPVNLPKRA